MLNLITPKTSTPVEEKLEIALLRLYPEMRPALAKRYVTKYVEVVINAIAESIRNYGLDSRDELSWPLDQIKRDIGRNKSGMGSIYIFDLMDEHPSTKLVEVMNVGNNLKGLVSKIQFVPAYKKDIMDKLKSLVIELDPARLKEIEENSNLTIRVEKSSIDSYIRATRASLELEHKDRYREKLTRNLLIAQQLHSMVKTENGIDYVKEQYSVIDSGRMYGHGLSLQRIPKQVRHAALGHCYMYDFQACSYALFASFARKIDPNIRVAALLDFIQYRDARRSKIAQDVGVDENTIKYVFISMGFGAQVKDNPHNSIRETLGKIAYEKLVTHPDFSLIKRQLDDVVAVIHAHFPNDTFELLGRTYTNVDPNTQTKRTKSQKMAWIFQCMESHALEILVDSITQHPLLLVHDCAYYKQKVPLSELQNARFKLQQEFEFLTFDHTEIFPIHAAEDHVDPAQKILEQEYDHRKFIEEQERLAQSYAPKHVSVDNTVLKRKVQTNWGMIDEDLLPETSNDYYTEPYFKE